MASGPITSWQREGRKVEVMTDFIFLAYKITVDSDCSHDKSRQCIKKQKLHFANKGLYSQSHDFSNYHVWMWELDHEEDWALKNWYFQMVVLGKTLESPLDSKEIKPVNSKGNQHWEDWWLGHLMGRNHSLEKTLILGKTESKRRSGQWRIRWLDSIIYSMDMNLNKLQETVEDRGAWCSAVHGVAKSWTQVIDWTTIEIRGFCF